MKKLIFALFAALILAAPTFAAEAETASLPSFKVTLNGVEVKNEYREYPLFVYNDITYFPMTYFDCRFLGLTTEFDENIGLNIKRESISGMYRDYAADERNRSSWNVLPVVVPENFDFSTEHVERAHFPALINGKRVDESGDYPFLSFRGVTYFPLTWEYAHDMFGWEYGFGADGLVINSDNYHTEILDLPGFDGEEKTPYITAGANVALYGGYYFYQAGQDIFRAPADNTAAAESIYTMPLPPYFEGAAMGTTARPAEFSVRDGELRVTFTDVDTATFTNSYNIKYDPAKNTFVEDDKPESVSNATGPSPQYWYADDFKVEKAYYISYQKGEGERVYLKKLGYAKDCRLVGHVIYAGFGEDYSGPISLGVYKINMDTGEITRIAGDVTSLWAFAGPKEDLIYTYTEGEGLSCLNTGERIISGPDEIRDVALVGEELAVVSKADGLTRLRVIPEYGGGKAREILSTKSYAYYGGFDGGFYMRLGEELPDEERRLVVLKEGKEPFISSDYVGGFSEKIFACGEDFIYVTDGKAVHVTLDRPAR